MPDAPVVAACVSWDEVYPVVHLHAVAPCHDQQLTPIPVDLAGRYAEAYVAWQQVQRDLKRYLTDLHETTKLAPAGA